MLKSFDMDKYKEKNSNILMNSVGNATLPYYQKKLYEYLHPSKSISTVRLPSVVILCYRENFLLSELIKHYGTNTMELIRGSKPYASLVLTKL